MVTKGVASVRSPVHNLRQFKSDVTHSAFVDAVVKDFSEEYETDTQVTSRLCIISIPETLTISHNIN
jgi:lipoate---protein ligase